MNSTEDHLSYEYIVHFKYGWRLPTQITYFGDQMVLATAHSNNIL